ncbi:hypothetical protein [Leucobacter sp. NPDC077196]|uniref:hypothetical protein n=1 Tax=Leucobacter sp. NPDC077196 TaxID=3154959 RepID=UPI0034137DBC
MAQVKLKLRELNKLMRSAPVQAKVNEEGARMANRAGSKFRLKPDPHKWTARSFVESKPGERLSDADRIALLRSLGG